MAQMTYRQQIATRVMYEFVINEMDDEDILDNHPCETLAELLRFLPDYDDRHIEIEVWKLVGSDAEGITDREYLQIDGNELPSEFSGGAVVPKHVSRQFTVPRMEVLRERLSR